MSDSNLISPVSSEDADPVIYVVGGGGASGVTMGVRYLAWWHVEVFVAVVVVMSDFLRCEEKRQTLPL